MYCVGLLLCAASIWVCSVTGLSSTPAPPSPAPSTPAPPRPAPIPEMLQFQCISNGGQVDIEIDTKLTSSNSICEEENKCTGGIDQPTESVLAKLKTCPKDKSITLVVTKSSGRTACGGDGAAYFNLYCLTGTDMEKVVNHSIAVHRNSSLGGSTPLPKDEYEVVDLAMAFFKNDRGEELHNAVTIGMTLYVLISSPNVIKLKVGMCTAYSNSENLPLLDSSGNYTAANRDGVLLETFNRSSISVPVCNTGTCFLSRLHAFHFKNSMEVSLECYINVCPNAIACKTSRRRRRNSNSDRHVVRARILVYDSDDLHGTDIEGRNSGRPLGLPVFVMTPFAVLFVFMGYI